jgi:Ca2+/Na+ antiporter
MDKQKNVIDTDFSFYINITWWEILLALMFVAFLIYTFRKKRKSNDMV